MQVVLADVAAQIGDFLEAGDVASGVVLDLLDRLGRVQQIIGRARVKPGKITIQLDDMKLVAAQVFQIDVRDFEFAARRGFQAARDVDDLVIIKIDARDNIVRFGKRGFSSIESALPVSSNSTTPNARGSST